MNNIKLCVFIVLLVSLSEVVSSPYCKDSNGVDLIEILLYSPIVVQASVTTIMGKQRVYNASGKVLRIFDTQHGNFSKHSVFDFGPVGKAKNCAPVKVGKSYILFLNNQSYSGFNWISYNPLRSKSKTLKSVHKLLRRKGLTSPSFKKPSKAFKKPEGKKLKIKCKAAGQPRPDITWYYNNQVLTNVTATKDIIVKRKKGSGSLVIEHIDKKYDGAAFVCSASNPVSPTAVNYTVFVTISKFLSGTSCARLCGIEDRSYCIDGQCCVHDKGTDGSSFYCRCYSGSVGPRCNVKDYSAIQARKPPEYRHMQRLIAVLGMCLALMLVVFVCIAVYCLFKRSRSKMHRSLLKETSHHNTSLIKLQNQPDESSAMPTDIYNTSSFTITDGINPNSVTIQNAGNANEMVIRDTVEHQKVEVKLSRASAYNGSKRSRLNGLAKNEPSPQNPAKRLVSSRNNSPVSTPLYKLRTIPNDAKQSSNLDNPSPHQGREKAVIPVDNAILNLVSHHSNASSLTSSPQLHDQYKSIERSPLETRKLSPLSSPVVRVKNHKVTTFSPSGYVKKESFDWGDGSLSLVTSHTSLASPKSAHSNSSMPVKPLSQSSDGSTLHQLASNESCNANYNNNSCFEKPEVARLPLLSTSDNDDLFSGVDIPDTSLGLYSQQSLERNKMYRQNALSSDGDYAYPTVINSPRNIPASAELLQVPLLSKEDQLRVNDDFCSSTISLSSNLSSDLNANSDSDSHKIVV